MLKPMLVCSGIHRKIGTHITCVKSVTLDIWKPSQVENMRAWGNLKANDYYMPHADMIIIPIQDASAMEMFIRDKYERKAFMEGSTKASKYKVLILLIHNDVYSSFMKERGLNIRSNSFSLEKWVSIQIR